MAGFFFSLAGLWNYGGKAAAHGTKLLGAAAGAAA